MTQIQTGWLVLYNSATTKGYQFVIHLLLFDDMKGYFRKASLAKYAMVYMVQPLTLGVPPFCLACIGTNNKFTKLL